MMNKKNYLMLAALFLSLVSLTSCKESSGVDEYADWQARNESYLDFVASQAKANQGTEVGRWKIIKAFNLGPDSENTTSNIHDYIYARINKTGSGAAVLYADSVSVYYRGVLINGVVFDYSPAFVPKNALSTDTIFAGKPDDSYGDIYKHVVYYPDLDILNPSDFKVQQPGIIVGWITALQEMKEGDYWTIYIPASLGYGSSAYLSIPGNSLLIFDLYLGKRFLKKE